jgi:hypothetical protein
MRPSPPHAATNAPHASTLGSDARRARPRRIGADCQTAATPVSAAVAGQRHLYHGARRRAPRPGDVVPQGILSPARGGEAPAGRLGPEDRPSIERWPGRSGRRERRHPTSHPATPRGYDESVSGPTATEFWWRRHVKAADRVRDAQGGQPSAARRSGRPYRDRASSSMWRQVAPPRRSAAGRTRPGSSRDRSTSPR